MRKTRTRIGFIFQQFNLVGRLSLFTNVALGSLGRIDALLNAAKSDLPTAQADTGLLEAMTLAVLRSPSDPAPMPAKAIFSTRCW